MDAREPTTSGGGVMSEPEAGSNLASLRTRACGTKRHFVVTASRLVTSWGHRRNGASYMCAPNPDAPKNKGIYCLLGDMPCRGSRCGHLVTSTARPIRGSVLKTYGCTWLPLLGRETRVEESPRRTLSQSGGRRELCTRDEGAAADLVADSTMSQIVHGPVARGSTNCGVSGEIAADQISRGACVSDRSCDPRRRPCRVASLAKTIWGEVGAKDRRVALTAWCTLMGSRGPPIA